jgi:hypothetical protein
LLRKVAAMAYRLAPVRIKLLVVLSLLFLAAFDRPTAPEQPPSDEAAAALRRFNAVIAVLFPMPRRPV